MALVEGHQCGQRQRSGLQTDHEEEEMAGGNHEIHSEERHENQLVELTLADSHLVALRPGGRLQEDDEYSDVEDGLHGLAGRVVDIHAAEHRLSRAGRNDPYSYCGESEQDGCHRREPFLGGPVAREHIRDQHDEEESQDYEFGEHRPKL